jgi:nucleotide-binding universal stress UspA family protein
MNIGRIVVGVDGSPNGHRALEWAAGLAERLGAELVAVHALGLLERLDDGEPVPVQGHRDEVIERFERTWCAPLDESPVPSRRLARDGNPVSALLAVADEVGADLVVVGSRGVGDRPELLLGSTSTQVAQRSRRPVVVIPAADP